MRFRILLNWTLFITLAASGAAAERELRRKALFGAELAEVAAEVRKQPALKKGGVLLKRVIQEASAATAGFKDGDIVVSLGEANVPDVASFMKAVSDRRAGDRLDVRWVRDGKLLQTQVTLKEKPREKGDGYEVNYSSVTNGAFRQRTIITHPRKDGRHPAVLFLQGGQTCFPVDAPFGRPGAFIRIAQHLARNGYVTMRIERPGCGDSEGGPLRDVDFDTELAGNREAVRALKQSDFVDADNVLIYGFSMGGIMAPLIATEEPVRGIATYGTTCLTWFEGLIGQRRRLLLLQGKTPAQVNSEIIGHIRFWYQLAVEGKTVQEILDTKTTPQPVLDLWAREAPLPGRSPFHLLSSGRQTKPPRILGNTRRVPFARFDRQQTAIPTCVDHVGQL